MTLTNFKTNDAPESGSRGWILLGSPGDGDTLLRDDVPQGVTNWTTHREAQIGDYVFFYITSPVKAIVASGRIATAPELQNDARESWYKKYFSVISELRSFPQIVTIRELKALFPEWRYWQQPRTNSLVPEDDIVQNFLEMLH